MATQIQVRRDTESNWDDVTTTAILAVGEIGLIVDQTDLPSKVIGAKIGDGNTDWGTLPMHIPLMSGVQNKLELDGSAATPSNATTTFLLKGISQQEGAVFGIEEVGSGTDLVISIDKTGGITAAAGVNVSGGYDATNDAYGITIDTNGNVQSNTGIESGDYIADCTKGGVLLSTDVPASPDGTDPTYGKLDISVKSGVTATNNVIEVRNNNAEVFVVEADGDIDKVKNITATGLTTTVGLTTTAGITNSGAVIAMGGQKITGLGAPSADTTDAATSAYVDAADTTATSARTAGFFLGSIGAIWRSGTASSSQQIYDSDLTATLGGTTVTSNGKTWTKSTFRLGYYLDPWFGGTTSMYLYIRTA